MIFIFFIYFFYIFIYICKQKYTAHDQTKRILGTLISEIEMGKRGVN